MHRQLDNLLQKGKFVRLLLTVVTALAFSMFATPANQTMADDDIYHYSRLVSIQEVHQAKRSVPVPIPDTVQKPAPPAATEPVAEWSTPCLESRVFGPDKIRDPPAFA